MGLYDDEADQTPRPRTALLVGGIVLAGGAVLALAAFLLTRAAGTPPRLPEEAAVARYLADQSPFPESVVYERWGPHELAGPARTVRLRYVAKDRGGARARLDCLFTLEAGRVVREEANPYGDGWVEVVRKDRQALDQMRESLRITP